MTIGTTAGVLIFSSPSALFLIFGWRRWMRLRPGPETSDWRAEVLKIGLVLGTVSQILGTAFLVSGFRSDGQSFAQRASTAWAVSNWVTLLTWALTLFAVLVGKGKIRPLLLSWTVVMPLTSWLIFMAGYMY